MHTMYSGARSSSEPISYHVVSYMGVYHLSFLYSYLRVINVCDFCSRNVYDNIYITGIYSHLKERILQIDNIFYNTIDGLYKIYK